MRHRRLAVNLCLAVLFLLSCTSQVPNITLPPLPSLPPTAAPTPSEVPVPSVDTEPTVCTAVLPEPSETRDPTRGVESWADATVELRCMDETVTYTAYSDEAICTFTGAEGEDGEIEVSLVDDSTALSELSVPRVSLGPIELEHESQSYRVLKGEASDVPLRFVIRDATYRVDGNGTELVLLDYGSTGDVTIEGTLEDGMAMYVRVACGYLNRS